MFYEVIQKNFFQITFSIFLGGLCSKRGYQQAIPLCLPNNCNWDSETGQYVQTEEERRSLYVVEEALEQLRKIKGKILSGYSLSNGTVQTACSPPFFLKSAQSLSHPARLQTTTVFLEYGIETRRERTILVPRACRLLVTWSKNEGLWKQLTSGRAGAEVTNITARAHNGFLSLTAPLGKKITS